MKKRIPTFLAGMLTTALIGSLGITALAATGAMTISVDPINIQVNGATFAPKDAQGNSVPVFAYNNTTYAPLRALAEAYGLEVGYDAKANMATVGEVAATPDTTRSDDYSTWTAEEEKAYQEFRGMWTRNEANDFIGSSSSNSISLAVNCDNLQALKNLCAKHSQATMRRISARYSNEITQSLQAQGSNDLSVFYDVNGQGVWDDISVRNGKAISSFLSSAIRDL